MCEHVVLLIGRDRQWRRRRRRRLIFIRVGTGEQKQSSITSLVSSSLVYVTANKYKTVSQANKYKTESI